MKTNAMPIALLAPLVVVMAIFVVGLVAGILQGFGYIPAFGLFDFSLKYFREVLSDSRLLESIALSLYIALTSAVITITLATILSYALVTATLSKGLSFALIKLPMFIPWMVTGLISIQLLSGSGWFARLFNALGLEAASLAMKKVLFQPHHLGVIFAFVWACIPFATFLILSVMENLKHSYAEAASSLGANLWQNFWLVTLPLSKPVIRDVFLIVMLTCFGSYEIPVILGMTAPRALPVEIFYQYNHFDLKHRPFAMALNTVMLLIALLLAAIFYYVWNGKRSQRTHNQRLAKGQYLEASDTGEA